MPTLEEMRAEINRLLPDFETPQFVKNIQTAYQNMPGAAIPQAALSLGSNLVGAPLGAAYGVGKTLLSDKFGTQEGIKLGQQEAGKVMNALRYTPPTRAGREIAETIERLPQTLTGSEMGIGMLPEIWRMPPRISPSDVQVMGARGINTAREIADIPRDFQAAQSGMTRMGANDKPTYGARLQSVAEDIGDVMARRQALRSDEGGTTLPKMDVLSDLVTDMNMYAIKPKGGNWPTTLGSTESLANQRMLGKRLSETQFTTNENDLVTLFEAQVKKYDQQNGTNLSRILIKDYFGEESKGKTPLEQINSFVYDWNEKTKDPEQPPLPTLDRIEKAIPTFNQWVMGPYQKYIRNEQATGLATDPLLAVVNRAEVPLPELFPSARERDYLNLEQVERYRQNALKRLAKDETIDLTQPQYANVGKQTATTPVGKQYEDFLDTDIGILVSPLVLDKEKYPFVSKLNLDAPVYDLQYSLPERNTGFKDISNYVMEGLISGKYNPEKIGNLPPHVVVQDMLKDYQNRLKEEQRSKEAMQTYRLERAKQLQTDTQFGDGSRMVVFNKASYDQDPEMLKRDFGQITKDLNQCIGAGCHGTPDYPGHGPAIEPHTGRPPRGSAGELSYPSYYDMVKDGRGEIVSLIDPDAKYQFTIQIKYDRNPLSQREQEAIAESWVAQNKPDHLDAFLKHKEEYGGGSTLNAIMRNFPEIKQVIADITKANTKKEIRQMRGADNGNVAEAFESHVVDWLNKNADDLSSVEDLDQIPGVMYLGMSSPSLAGQLRDYDQDYDFDTAEEFIDRIKEEKLLPKFFYPGDVENLAYKLGVDLTEAPAKQLSPYDSQIVAEEFERYITDDPESLYAQDNLQDKFVKDINLLTGYPDKYNLPIDIHRKLVKMILSDNQSQINSVISQLDSWVNRNQILPLGFTYSEATDAYNLLNRWYNRHPRKDEDRIWKQYPEDLQAHPNPFDEIKLDQKLPRPSNTNLIQQDLDLYFQGRDRLTPIDNPEANRDIGILMGDQTPAARIPLQMHMKFVRALLAQDDNTRQIRNSLERLRAGDEVPGLTQAQRDNIQTMLEQWLEIYPLRD